ncbi:Fic family protein [Pedobacter westerhofensis]|uniref:Fic family protein n=1 Tax=Pedobacter westerhofensis TaxID=425512 RepID=A0A521BMW8_9SPHI|nr:Fic family protein [Pedobacter westerhofensis]SMO48488.1 Fic family protein [Pedobacter westerhofensis]
MYNWQFPEWPDFYYETEEIQSLILAFAQETGEISGVMQGLSDDLKQEALLQLILSEATKTSEIEGEYISREDIMSSIRNNLGLNETLINVKDQRAGAVAQLMLEVRKSFDQPLNLESIQAWHKMLMANSSKINPGLWRVGAEPMQIVSGAYGREVVHYEALPSSDVPKEMDQFVQWYAAVSFPLKGEVAKAVLKSAISHLYFESIHPFEDGNGRIGRTIAEKALSQTMGRPVMLSLSKTIEQNKPAYYTALKEAQRTLNITAWISYFATVILEAQRDAKAMVQFTLKKAQFFDRYKNQLNERQLKALNKMLEQGANKFEGGMTAKKYIGITKTSKATATRDLQELQKMNILLQEGTGRSVKYHLNLP